MKILLPRSPLLAPPTPVRVDRFRGCMSFRRYGRVCVACAQDMVFKDTELNSTQWELMGRGFRSKRRLNTRYSCREVVVDC